MNKPFDLDSRQHTYSKKNGGRAHRAKSRHTAVGCLIAMAWSAKKKIRMKIRWWNIIDSVWFAKQLLQTNYVPSSVRMKRLKIRTT